jgi:hypothetical protein
MAELEKNKAGLQKKVSSVFKGVPIPQDSSTQQPAGAPAPDRAAEVSPKPTPTERQIPQTSLIKKLQQSEESPNKAAPEHAAAAPKPAPTTSSQKSQNPPVEKPRQPDESLNKAGPAKQPGGDPSAEAAGPSFLQKIKDKLFTPKPGASSTRQKAMVVLVPVLAIIMIFMFRQVLSKAPHNTEGATNDDAPPLVAIAGSDNEIDWQIPEPLPAMMRDPIKLPDQDNTQSGGQEETTGETKTGIINVRDIVYSKDKPSAVVGTHIVYVGDKINDVTIVRIERDSVEFEKDGKRWVEKIHE